MDKITAVTEGKKLLRSFTYHMDGQIASAIGVVRRPAAVAGKLRGPVPQSPSGLMIHRNSTESIGETDNADVFFTGKPLIGDLGYAFLFRNYRAEQGKWQTADPLGYPDGWNNLAYVNNGVTENIDLLGFVTIYIGGASEHSSTDTLEEFMNSHCPKCGALIGGGTESPYSWDQKDDIIDFIKSLPDDESIIIVGHSYGGDTAYLVTRDCGRSVDTLITFDPVSRLTFNISAPSNANAWYNIYVTGHSCPNNFQNGVIS